MRRPPSMRAACRTAVLSFMSGEMPEQGLQGQRRSNVPGADCRCSFRRTVPPPHACEGAWHAHATQALPTLLLTDPLHAHCSLCADSCGSAGAPHNGWRQRTARREPLGAWRSCIRSRPSDGAVQEQPCGSCHGSRSGCAATSGSPAGAAGWPAPQHYRAVAGSPHRGGGRWPQPPAAQRTHGVPHH